MKTIYVVLLLLFPLLSWGQKNLDFLSSSELIQKGLEYHQEEKYYEAIQEYRKVGINDTNYATAQYEMALSYMGMEEYKTAQDVLKELLEFDLRYDFEHRVYSLLGSAYDDNEETDKALETYSEGIRRFPMQHNLYFNRGVTYERLKEYDKALADYQQAIQCNMYHANSHLRLGLLVANEGKYAQATLSLMTFLLLEPTDSRAPSVVSILEKMADGELEEEPKNIATLQDNYEELNLFYKNQIALQKSYKVKFTISTSYARQLHMILKNSSYDENNLDFWNQHYLPFMKLVWDEKKLDHFVMLSLASVENENIQAKLNKSISKIKDFISWATVNFKSTIANQYMEFEGKKQFVNVEYEPQYFSGYGKVKADGTPIGTFYYYHPNGSKRMNAYFDDNGKPTGSWEIFNMYNGNLERKIIFKGDNPKNKTQEEYYFSGELYLRYQIVDGYAEGTVETFYRNGTPKETYEISRDLKNGNYKAYYPNGTLEYDLNYKDGELEGKYISYHLNGQKAEEFEIKEGKVVGKRTSYYPNGQLESEYSYKEGLYEGPYTIYFADGKTKETGSYKAGKSIGELTEYYPNGQISNSRVLDENGKQNGNSIFYDVDGKKFHEIQFSKGNLTKVIYFDKAGTATELVSKKGKKVDYIINYPDGTMKIKGQYVESERDGNWNYFDRYGNLELTEYYKNGVLEDTVKRYFSNGQLKSVCGFSNGERNGIYLEYNIFGTLTEEGFYKNGNYDREWYSYYDDGSMEYENYFVEGTKNGIQKSYGVNGKLVSWEQYDMGRVIAHVFLDTNEQVINEYGEYNGVVELYNPTKSYINYRAEYKNGNADGDIKWYAPDNVIETSGHFTNSERSGEWKWYYEGGKLSQEVTYVNGERQGAQKSYYENGKLSHEENFINDQVEGPFKYYHDNGVVNVSGTYLDDERHGKATYYSPEGSVAVIRNYDQGVIVSYTYLDKEGKEVTPIPLNQKELKFVTFFKNGKKSSEHLRKNGLIEGLYLTYHDNGLKFEETNFLHGEEHGKSYEYNEAGQKTYEADYQYGKLHGKEITYYANGKIKSEVTYVLGSRHGKSIRYAQDGKVISVTIYYNNEIVSIQKN